jgi:hypothetical protein
MARKLKSDPRLMRLFGLPGLRDALPPGKLLGDKDHLGQAGRAYEGLLIAPSVAGVAACCGELMLGFSSQISSPHSH